MPLDAPACGPDGVTQKVLRFLPTGGLLSHQRVARKPRSSVQNKAITRYPFPDINHQVPGGRGEAVSTLFPWIFRLRAPQCLT